MFLICDKLTKGTKMQIYNILGMQNYNIIYFTSLGRMKYSSIQLINILSPNYFYKCRYIQIAVPPARVSRPLDSHNPYSPSPLGHVAYGLRA
jgi:hypothetical protein